MKMKKSTMSICALLLALGIGSCAAEIAETRSSLLNISGQFTNRDMQQEISASQTTILALESDSIVYVTKEGIYYLSGTYSQMTIVVEAEDDSKKQFVLDDLVIENSDSPAIYVKSADKVFITTDEGESSLAVTGDFAKDGSTNLDAVIFSRSDLVFNGKGNLQVISSRGNGIASKDDLKITGGNIYIDAAEDGLEANDSIRIAGGNISIQAGADALHSENDDNPLLGYIYIQKGNLEIAAGDDAIRGNSTVQIDNGEINITTCSEGIEATQVQINGGKIDIYSTDDGINAAKKSTLDVLIEVNGGEIAIEMAAGDTDGFDSNGDLRIHGGTIEVTARSSFDADGTVLFSGGTVIVNGEEVSELPIQMMGGPRKQRW